MRDPGPEPRFAFGRNWERFLRGVDERRIADAERTLRDSFPDDLTGRTFLDLGCGSGLSSLAARRLGATAHSVDIDAEAVACARVLRERYRPGDAAWRISQGSALDAGFLRALGRFDVVYSWGVLHHTGAMWKGLGLACQAVGPRGYLLVALYNDQGRRSRMWRDVKRTYNRLPGFLRPAYAAAVWIPVEAAAALKSGRPVRHLRERREGLRRRGMSWWRDVVDWVGGYPFEVARPEAVVAFCEERGFQTIRSKLSGGGCNEFLLQRAV